LPAYGGGAAFGVGMIHGVGLSPDPGARVRHAAGAGTRVAGLLVLAVLPHRVGSPQHRRAIASTFGLTARAPAPRSTPPSPLSPRGSLALGLLYVFGKGRHDAV